MQRTLMEALTNPISYAANTAAKLAGPLAKAKAAKKTAGIIARNKLAANPGIADAAQKIHDGLRQNSGMNTISS